MTEILSQIIGILALCVTIICYQFNDQKKILIMQIIASVLFMTNLALRDAMAGALLNIHGICRALVFYQRGRYKWADSPLWAVLFSVLAVVCVAVTWKSPIDILPAVGTIFTTIAYYMTDPKWIRRITLPSPPMWFVYHLSTMNIGGVLNEIFVTISIVTAMFRYDFRRRSGNEAQTGAAGENSK